MRYWSYTMNHVIAAIFVNITESKINFLDILHNIFKFIILTGRKPVCIQIYAAFNIIINELMKKKYILSKYWKR